MKVIFAHANQSPEKPSSLNPDIPRDLEAVIMKCLEKNPDDRYQSIDQLQDALLRTSCRDCWTQQQAADWWSNADATPQSAEETSDADVSATALMQMGVEA